MRSSAMECIDLSENAETGLYWRPVPESIAPHDRFGSKAAVLEISPYVDLALNTGRFLKAQGSPACATSGLTMSAARLNGPLSLSLAGRALCLE